MNSYIWNPWSIFDELERSMFASSPSGPQFDIEDTEDETVLVADVPGMTEDDLDVTMHGQYLIVRGERTAREGRYVRRGRFHGAFERRFFVGDHYDLDRVQANIANGELTIRLAKAAKAKPRRIKLTTGLVDKVKGLLSGDKEKEKDRAA